MRSNRPRQLILPLQLNLRVLAGNGQPEVAGDFAVLDGAAADLLPEGDVRALAGVQIRRPQRRLCSSGSPQAGGTRAPALNDVAAREVRPSYPKVLSQYCGFSRRVRQGQLVGEPLTLPDALHRTPARVRAEPLQRRPPLAHEPRVAARPVTTGVEKTS
jgi:hypothetical protein